MITNKPNRQNVRKLGFGKGLYKPYGQQGGTGPAPGVGKITGSVDTDTVSDGTLYTLADSSAADPPAGTIKANAQATQAVSGVTTQNITINVTLPNGTYYLHYVQETTGGFSNVITSPPFPVPSTPINTVVFDGTFKDEADTVIFLGIIIRPDSVLFYDEGKATAGSSTTCQDTTKTWTPGEWVGYTFRDTSDGTFVFPATSIATGIISDNTADTLTFSPLSGGDTDTVAANHYYEIVVGGIVSGDEIEYETTTDLGGTVTMTPAGVPSIDGVNGLHSFQWRMHQISPDTLSPFYTLTIQVV